MPNHRVAILRARHDTDAARISDTACSGVLIANAGRTAVFQYWQDVSLGHLTFRGSRMFPWVDIEIDATSEQERGRQNLYRRAREATERAGHDLSDFDAVMVLVHPGSATVNYVVIPRLGTGGLTEEPLDAGATSDGDLGVAVVKSDTDHTFMCHELGHALDWRHTFGLWNHGSDWDGDPPFTLDREYGDPYDIMSSATFGSRWLDAEGPSYQGSPGFTLTAPLVSGWPDPVPWRGLGPGPAQAHLHLYAPEALERHGRVEHLDMPGPGESRRVSLWAASSPADGNRTTLVAIHPPDEDAQGRRRYYVEYRDTKGWDRGLETTGDDLSRRAVVLHRLADGQPGDVRCWYQGRVVVPLEIDADASVPRLPLSVRVIDAAPDFTRVTVELTRSSDRAVFISRTDKEETAGFTKQRTDRVQTLCGELTAEWGIHRVIMRSLFRARSYGFGGANTGITDPPVVNWTINGKRVDDSMSTVDIEIAGPRRITVDIAVNPDEGTLSMASRPDHGQYRLSVVATVTEAGGGSPTASEAVTFEADGLQFGYQRTIQQQLRSCIEDVLNKARVRPQEVFLRPVDAFRRRDTDRLHRMKLTNIAHRLRVTNPKLASELQHLITLRYGAVLA